MAAGGSWTTISAELKLFRFRSDAKVAAASLCVMSYKLAPMKTGLLTSGTQKGLMLAVYNVFEARPAAWKVSRTSSTSFDDGIAAGWRGQEATRLESNHADRRVVGSR